MMPERNEERHYLSAEKVISSAILAQDKVSQYEVSEEKSRMDIYLSLGERHV